ncbi:dynamin family protein [Nonomuraea sp. NPDC003804]|uniref:dynamin family protein n=1 Tax=Nonomuraea sp. NPDC003804 TaxID=3154547 RepID=UPI0033AA3264
MEFDAFRARPRAFGPGSEPDPAASELQEESGSAEDRRAARVVGPGAADPTTTEYPAESPSADPGIAEWRLAEVATRAPAVGEPAESPSADLAVAEWRLAEVATGAPAVGEPAIEAVSGEESTAADSAAAEGTPAGAALATGLVPAEAPLAAPDAVDTGEAAAGATASDEAAAAAMATGEGASLETPASGEATADDVPAIGVVATSAIPAGETPAAATPAGDTPVGDNPVGEVLPGEGPFSEVFAGDSPFGETIAGETPAGDTPLGEVVADGAFWDENSAEKVAADDQAVSETPAADETLDERGTAASQAVTTDEIADDSTTEAESTVEAEPASDAEPLTETDSVTEADFEVVTDPEAVTEFEAVTDPEAGAGPEAVTDTDAAADPEPMAEFELMAEVASVADDEFVVESDTEAGSMADDELAIGDGSAVLDDEPALGDGTAVEEDEAVGRVVEEDLPDAAAQALTAALDALRDAVAGLRFGLDLPGAEEARKAQTEILTQLHDYVLPRVRMSTAPALIVVAGSTGAGKSTLVNTLAEKNVSRTGVRRPTTGIPVLACHPDDEGWFADGELLAGLQRIERQSREAAPDSLVLVTTERLPQGVALLDTPDIDSVVEEHHEIARRMLDAADLWVFVTTAARYADAPAWNLLRLAKERAARIAIVLSRVQPKTKDVVLKHFVRMLTEYGLGDVERFVIEESAVTDGRLPHGDMTELRLWLAELSVDEERRAQAVQETLNGVLNSFRTRVPALARHLESQVAFRGELRTDVDVAYSDALAHIDNAVRDGSLMRGEARARWQDFAGSGDLTRSFRKKGKPVPTERITAFRAALRTAIESLITSAAHAAADEVGARWRRRTELGAGLDRPSDDLARRTGRAVAAWQDHVTELLRTDGVTKRSAKVVSLGAESFALIFMVGLFSADELPQKLLRSLLGAEALRSISTKALSDLRARIVMLFDEEAMRYVRALDAAGIPDEAAATRLYQATYNLEVAR